MDIRGRKLEDQDPIKEPKVYQGRCKQKAPGSFVLIRAGLSSVCYLINNIHHARDCCCYFSISMLGPNGFLVAFKYFIKGIC